MSTLKWHEDSVISKSFLKSRLPSSNSNSRILAKVSKSPSLHSLLYRAKLLLSIEIIYSFVYMKLSKPTDN